MPQAKFRFKADKKHSALYEEVDDNNVPYNTYGESRAMLGTVYVKRAAFPQGMPRKLTITVDSAD